MRNKILPKINVYFLHDFLIRTNRQYVVCTSNESILGEPSLIDNFRFYHALLFDRSDIFDIYSDDYHQNIINLNIFTY